jgi:hypothetical protein
MALAVPFVVEGHGFSRAAWSPLEMRALAPEGRTYRTEESFMRPVLVCREGRQTPRPEDGKARGEGGANRHPFHILWLCQVIIYLL